MALQQRGERCQGGHGAAMLQQLHLQKQTHGAGLALQPLLLQQRQAGSANKVQVRGQVIRLFQRVQPWRG